jgi:hypothetical protein
MRCSEFLLRYSDFRDEAIDDPRQRRRFISHLSRCSRCARYHEVIDRGVAVLRSADPVEASPGFRRTLGKRLAAALLRPEPIFAFPVRFAGSLAVAAAVAVLVVEGVTQNSRTVEPQPAPARPMPMVQAHPRPPFVTFGDLEAPERLRTQSWTGGTMPRASQGLVTLTSLTAAPE